MTVLRHFQQSITLLEIQTSLAKRMSHHRSLISQVSLALIWCGLAGCFGCQTVADNSEVIRVNATDVICGNAEELTQSGIVAFRKGDLETAETLFKNAVQLDETYAPAYNNLGRIYFQRGDSKHAADSFSMAMELMPGRPEPINNMGLIYESANMLEQAIDFYSQAIETAPNNSEYLANLLRARIRRGDRGPDIRAELQSLRLMENRPEWIAWADRNLALFRDEGAESVGEDFPSLQTSEGFDSAPRERSLLLNSIR